MERHSPAPENCSVAILGNPGAGKTALISALVGQMNESWPPATQLVGNEFDFDNRAGIFDFAGELRETKLIARLRSIEPTIAILVMASNEGFFESRIDEWAFTLNQACDEIEVTKFLVITKSDLDSSPEELNQAWLARHNFKAVLSTSVLKNTGIQNLREELNEVMPEQRAQDEVAVIIGAMVDNLCRLIARRNSTLFEIEWRDLERVVARALQGLGFRIELTRGAMDGGKDVVAKCIVDGKQQTYYIEIKHWLSKTQPGKEHVTSFVEVNARNSTNGGLFLSTTGFTGYVYRHIGEICEQNVRLGDEEKIVSLCQHYTQVGYGVFSKQGLLPELLFERTIG